MAKKADMFVGRRKNATARAYLTPLAEGKKAEITINGRELSTYFANELHRDDLVRPLKLANVLGSYSVNANVRGGGTSGQAGAVRLAIARALVDISEEHRTAFRKEELMTRDPRMVERKKSGQPKARKRFQFSKR